MLSQRERDHLFALSWNPRWLDGVSRGMAVCAVSIIMLAVLIFVEGREMGGTKWTFAIAIIELQHKENTNGFSYCEKAVEVKIKQPAKGRDRLCLLIFKGSRPRFFDHSTTLLHYVPMYCYCLLDSALLVSATLTCSYKTTGQSQLCE